ncbi:MAG: L-2-hydroxyglutarate oxidase [Limisphaerales bacterium]
MEAYDYVVIGGGIVGCSTAFHLGESFPGARVLLIEKEAGPARHQTGRNSGVIHSGIYYKPGSFKAKFARAGARSMVEFCLQHGIPHDVCGKVIVAANAREMPLLENLHQRGLQNEVPVEKVPAERVREIEPHVSCVAGLLVKSTGITSYVEVCRKFLELIRTAGGEVKFGQAVRRIVDRGNVKIIETDAGEFEAGFVINCAGLHSDRVARMAGADPGARIVPFRGEYFELVPEKRHLVNTLVYPVPNPDFPFLGVHFTRMIDGSVHAGPNAVLALKREGYYKTDFDLRDFSETMSFGGFWKLVSKNLGEGLKEMHRSISKSAFVRSLQQIIPEVRSEDLVPCKAGVRAQALFDDGRLVDDFLMVQGNRALHVCNAPSPAATAALEIGKAIVRQVSS